MASLATTPTVWTRATSPAHFPRDTESPLTSVEDGTSDHPRATQDEDIAIVGMGCRVPGDCHGTAELWDYLMNKNDACGEIPAFRWKAYYHRNPKNAKILAKTTSRGYFLEHLEDFDAAFFSISPREAEQMDPQQRLALEVAWEALEDAGIPPQSLAGSNTSVYMGVNLDDYAKLVLEDLDNIGAHMGVGTAYCGVPSRISYILDLMGPSIAVDAACASSLVAIHQARQAILAGETDLAIAGGVNALIGPGMTRVLDEAGAVSPDGRCRSFDDSANGYGRSEGAGVVVLKRMSKAVADGDRILSILKGTAVCADGKTAGIMAPNAKAQELVAIKALKEARVPASSISYIEAHATSTPLGDPTETAALARIYGHGARSNCSHPLPIGSIKSNIGHLEAGAGVMGVIKAVMVLREQTIPPQANLSVPSTKIDWKNSMLTVHTEVTPLRQSQSPARAAIASYGYSGTVSHAIIEAAESQHQLLSKSVPEIANAPTLLLLSAPKQSRIPVAAKALAEWLSQQRRVSIQDVANTLSSRRGHHKFRTGVVAGSPEEAIAALQKVAANEEDKYISAGRCSASAEKGHVWIFSGHGAQWPAMGAELYSTRKEFREVVHELEPIIKQELEFSVTEALQADGFEQTDAVQAMTFVMHIGIARVLEAESGLPSAIAGHSLGEAAAAVISGALSLREGTLTVCKRARLYRQVMGQGSMALVSLPYKEAAQRLSEVDGINAAIDASPSSCVISGSNEAMQLFCQQLSDEGIQVRKVNTDLAFHSKMLQKIAQPLKAELKSLLNPKIPRIPLYSTSTSDSRMTTARDADYWVDNMIQPVLLKSTVEAIAEDGFRAFVEISSHPIIAHSVNEVLVELDVDDFITLPTMLRAKPSQSSIMNTISKLHCFGVSTEYTTKSNRPWINAIPGTIWSHQPYWRQVVDVPFRVSTFHDPLSNTLLGQRLTVSGTNDVLYQSRLDETNKPFPGKHSLHGSEIVPAAVLINTFLHAVEGRALEDVSLRVPVVVSPARDIQIRLGPQKIAISLKLASHKSEGSSEGAWLVNTTSSISNERAANGFEKLDILQLKQDSIRELSSTFSIDYLAQVGVPDMGFPWKVLEHVETANGMLARVVANPEGTPGCNDNWTSILDSATSIASTIFYKEPLLRMPTAIDRVIKDNSAPSPDVAYIFCKLVPGKVAADVLITDEQGAVLVETKSMHFAGIEGEGSTRLSTNGLVHRLCWIPASYSEKPTPIQHVAFLPEVKDQRISAFQKQLSAKGITTSVVEGPNDVTIVQPGSVIVFLPAEQFDDDKMLEASSRSCMWLANAVKNLGASPPSKKVFAVTDSSNKLAALRNGALHGLSRILISEAPERFGGLIDIEDDQFPLAALKYIKEEPVIVHQDGIPRISRLCEFPQPSSEGLAPGNLLNIEPSGTYLITGGLGSLGLEVASWMAQQGARRIVLVSRSRRLKRSQRSSFENDARIHQLESLEKLGASVHVVCVDMSVADAGEQLTDAIDNLSLPPVKGIVHAAGVLNDQLIDEITAEKFTSVLAPKINGAMHLHRAFPVGSLDFFVLFSSCGQLLGFPGQASYASGNAFLDELAAQRRSQGDNATAIQWTSWRGLGMAASTEYINAELAARGITDVTRDEAFLAWDKIARLQTDQAVVLRAIPIEADDPVPHPILADIVVRKSPVTVFASGTSEQTPAAQSRPKSGPELEKYLRKAITHAVASTLCMQDDAVDQVSALTEMGMDSVMTVQFRMEVQTTLRVRVPSTLVWKCPTINHLVSYFMTELGRA